MATEGTYMQQAIEITKAFGYEGSVEPWTRLIAEQIKLRESKPKDQPIRRGDVVQISPSGSMGCRPKTHVVTGVSNDGFVGLHNAPPIPNSLVVRICRANL